MALAAGAATCAIASGFALGSACRLRAEQEAEDRRVWSQERAPDKAPQHHAEATPEAPMYEEDDYVQHHRRQSPGVGRKRSKEAPGNRGERSFEADETIGWQGFSMEEARVHADEAQRMAMARTPGEVLADLQRGNTRFWMNAATRPEKSAFARRALISKQFPSVAVLGCSDSRVPVEIVFDQGLGDIFVIRVAGNCLDTSTLASLQYAVHHLKVKVLMVMGHEMCGAVKASQLPNEKLEQEPAELEQVLKNLKVGLNEEALRALRDSRSQDREAVTSNVRKQVERLNRDAGIASKVSQEELLVVGAFYELSSGIVDFFEVGPAPQPQEEKARPRAEAREVAAELGRSKATVALTAAQAELTKPRAAAPPLPQPLRAEAPKERILSTSALLQGPGHVDVGGSPVNPVPALFPVAAAMSPKDLKRAVAPMAPNIIQPRVASFPQKMVLPVGSPPVV